VIRMLEAGWHHEGLVPLVPDVGEGFFIGEIKGGTRHEEREDQEGYEEDFYNVASSCCFLTFASFVSRLFSLVG